VCGSGKIAARSWDRNEYSNVRDKFDLPDLRKDFTNLFKNSDVRVTNNRNAVSNSDSWKLLVSGSFSGMH
jgi:hypothetical protein